MQGGLNTAVRTRGIAPRMPQREKQTGGIAGRLGWWSGIVDGISTANYRLRGASHVSRTPRSEDLQCGRCTRRVTRGGLFRGRRHGGCAPTWAVVGPAAGNRKLIVVWLYIIMTRVVGHYYIQTHDNTSLPPRRCVSITHGQLWGRSTATANYRLRGASHVSRTPRSEDLQCGRCTRRVTRGGRFRGRGHGGCAPTWAVVGSAAGRIVPRHSLCIIDDRADRHQMHALTKCARADDAGRPDRRCCRRTGDVAADARAHEVCAGRCRHNDR